MQKLWCWRKEFGISAKRSFCHEVILDNTYKGPKIQFGLSNVGIQVDDAS